VAGARRDRAVRTALARGGFEPLSDAAVWTISIALGLLGTVTVVLIAATI
jgi:hypothetical protein